MHKHPPVGQAPVRRWLDKEHNVVVASGNFSALLMGYIDHTQRWDRAPDPLVATMMGQGLAAAALYLSCRPRDENVGWTLSFRDPLLGVFFTGDAGSNSVTGRYFEEGVKRSSANRLYVQSNREATGPVQSTIDIEGLDVLLIFEQFCERSDQQTGRFFDHDDGTYSMVLALPDCDRDWLRSMGRDDVKPLIKDQEFPLDGRQFVFKCGCSPERMVEVVRSIYEEDPVGFFEGHEEVEVQCPRCGRLWSVSQSQL